MRTLIYTLLLNFMVFQQAVAGYLVADLSAKNFIKGVDFTGREIVVSGIAENNSNIVATITGPKQDYKMWHKKKKYGLWSKYDPKLFKDTPSYFFVASSYKLTKKNTNLLSVLGLDSDYPYLPKIKKYKNGCELSFIDLQQKSGLFTSSIVNIEKIGSQIFRFKAHIPNSASVGKYNVNIHSIRFGEIVDTVELTFEINTIGFNKEITHFYKNNPLEYSIIAIATALFIGFFVAFLFRKDK